MEEGKTLLLILLDPSSAPFLGERERERAREKEIVIEKLLVLAWL